jgi:hypothetical protein
MSRKKHWVVGLTRIGQVEFKAGVTKAMQTEPDLCARLRHAIRATAAGRVTASTLNQFLQWIDEVEQATSAMVEAQCLKSTDDSAMPSAR